MRETDRRIINAIIKKAEYECPGALAMIGIYGSVATGDIHEKSDLDLMILINDERGYALAEGFILADTDVGYDLYCTTWKGLEDDAKCEHPHLSKLLDAQIVYISDQEAVCRLEQLQHTARVTLKSDLRFERSQRCLCNAKEAYADCWMTEEIAAVRRAAGNAIYELLDSVMLHHGRYFKMGTKRTFEEIETLEMSVNLKVLLLDVIRASTVGEIRSALTVLLKAVQTELTCIPEKYPASAENLAGTYEEMHSNWRNKMKEAAENNDVFASFMNMAFCDYMLHRIAENIEIKDIGMLEEFDPDRLGHNVDVFDSALHRYMQEYQKVGLKVKKYRDVDEFVKAYTGKCRG